MRGLAIERVTKFVECFPPLDRRWHPMTEAAAQYPVPGPIVLRARVDLVIGRPSGIEPRKVIVDLKSGRIVDRHREDLRTTPWSRRCAVAFRPAAWRRSHSTPGSPASRT